MKGFFVNIFRKILITSFYVFFLSVQSNECLGIQPNIIRVNAWIYESDNSKPVREEFRVDADHITKMNTVVKKDGGLGGLTGGHFISYFKTFRCNEGSFYVTTVGGKIRIGVVVPTNLMRSVVSNPHCMSGYGRDWVQVVWLNTNKQGDTKTLFGPQFSLENIVKCIENAGPSNPKYAYPKDGFIHNSFWIQGFSVPVSFVFNDKDCHTIFPRVDITKENKTLLIQGARNAFSDERFKNILQNAAQALRLSNN
jgi:hypothetical protein